MPSTEPLLVTMVGLPARGKTYVARKLERYLGWRGHRVRGFNIGEHRRHRLGGRQDAEFFNPDNAEGQRLIRMLAMEVLDAGLDWLDAGGGVAIFDATNTSQARRELVLERCAARNVRALFVEVIRNDAAVVEATIQETKLSLPDYAGMTAAQAIADFRKRIGYYERVYQSLAAGDLSFVQWIEGGEQVVLHRIEHEVDRAIAYFISNLRSVSAPVWLTRHGQSQHNVTGQIGGDPPLSPAGRGYAERLFAYVREREAHAGAFAVWASTLRRSAESAAPFSDVRTWRELDEIDAGKCEELTYAEIRERFPEIARGRERDKFHYRYPRGESYEDLIVRLDRIVLELERTTRPTLIIGHQAVLRVLYAYLMGTAPERCPHLDLPLHTVIELSPRVQGYEETRVLLGEGVAAGSSG